MNTLELLREGFANALTWPHLGWAFAGVTLGTAVGVLPGIGPALTVALLLPITFTLDPISAFIMFGGIYYGAMYGGSTTSILLNTPGETASIATAIDGYAMARQGRGAAALTTAAIGSRAKRMIRNPITAFHRPAIIHGSVIENNTSITMSTASNPPGESAKAASASEPTMVAVKSRANSARRQVISRPAALIFIDCGSERSDTRLTTSIPRRPVRT